MDTTAAQRDSRWPLVGDAGLAAACILLSATILLNSSFGGELGPAAWVLALLHTAPVAARRRAPRGAFVVSMGAGAAYLAAGYPMVGLAFTALVVMYSFAAYTSFRQSLGALALAEVAFVAAITAGGATPDWGTLIGDVLGLVAAWVLGDATRRRRDLATLYRQRADELEKAQMELARWAVTEERLRIARELHDVVAHSMTVIAVQAGTARMVLTDDAPEAQQAQQALAAIEASSRSALDEMRRLLGVLRDPTDAPERCPLPTLADLDHLVAAAVDAGTPVEVRIDGQRRSLTPGRELAAFRIIQEGLTNVRRYAPGATAALHLAFGTDELLMEIENEASAVTRAGGEGGGFGLVGMRERAAVYGGVVEVARRDGTFRVVARLPYGDLGE